MSFFDVVKGWFEQERLEMTFCRINPAQIEPGKGPFSPVQAVAGRHYLRFRLRSMFLSKQVAWFQSLYPAVHSLVRLNFGNVDSVEIPNIADTTKLRIQPKGGQGDIVARDFPLTPTLPFNGGIVSVVAGLVAITGQDFLGKYIKTLGTFADLLALPEISSSLKVAAPLAEGIQELFGAGNGRLHLALFHALDASQLISGCTAAIRVPDGQVAPSSLWVVDGRLHEGTAASQLKPFRSADHMVIGLDVFDQRDDFDSLSSIKTPMDEAIALAPVDPAQSAERLKLALVAAFRAPELTQAHRRIVADVLKARWKEASDVMAMRSGGGPSDSLAKLVAQATSPEEALRKGPFSLADALSGV